MPIPRFQNKLYTYKFVLVEFSWFMKKENLSTPFYYWTQIKLMIACKTPLAQFNAIKHLRISDSSFDIYVITFWLPT